MSKIIVQILKLDPPFPDVVSPNRTLFIDATAAQNLGMLDLINTGEIFGINFVASGKSGQMNSVLHSLEFPVGNIIRLTERALKFFNLTGGGRYWMEWNPKLNTLIILRKVNGK